MSNRRTILAAMIVGLFVPAFAQAQFENTTQNGQVTITKYNGPGGAVDIPDKINGLPVTSIGNGAFMGCASLSSVAIPHSVASIGNDAFRDCTNLTRVTIPNSVTGIGFWAFHACTSLTSVTIPDSVTGIDANAFGSCTNLSSITVSAQNPVFSSSEDGVVFNKNQTALVVYPAGKAGSSFTIPNGVTSIGNFAFSGCSNLTSITVSAQNPAFRSADGILFNRSQTTLIQYPPGKAGSYTIPDSVTSIEKYAFIDCHSLTSVTIPNRVTSIGEFAFGGCHSLTSVTIPNSVTGIGGDAFAGCHSLTSITFGNGVTSINNFAFTGCGGLKNAVFMGNAPTMGRGVFESAPSGFTVSYSNGATGFFSPTWTDSSGDSYPALVSSQSSDTAAQVAVGAPASGPANTSAATDGTTDKLKALKQQYDQGLITKEVYDQKVKEVLDGM